MGTIEQSPKLYGFESRKEKIKFTKICEILKVILRV